ncbi:MAG: mitochondrial fission ELM1 family protein [Hyphomonadaceae bacterium]
MVPGASVWCVADGRAGILNQTKALAAAMAAPAREVILQPHGLQLCLRPDLWPAPLSALPPEQRALLASPWPDVWIAAGRRSIPYSRLIRKLSAGRALVVQIQNPKVALSSFDLVVPPQHDSLTGPNVFPILGPPVWFSKDRIDAAHKQFAYLRAAEGQKVLVSLGGDSKTHSFTETRAAAIEADLRKLADRHRFWITASRRSPQSIRDRFRKLAQGLGAVFWEDEKRDGPNPYVAFLSMCDVALVTEDSANMLADPAFFGKPIYILKLEGGSERFDRLHQGFIAAGAARWFTGALDHWTYAAIREASRAADKIAGLLAGRRAKG